MILPIVGVVYAVGFFVFKRKADDGLAARMSVPGTKYTDAQVRHAKNQTWQTALLWPVGLFGGNK